MSVQQPGQTTCHPPVPQEGRIVKFSVERDVLADAVTWSARTLPTRPPVPVLAGVLLEADAAGSLTRSTFAYEASARSRAPAAGTKRGQTLVLCRSAAP